MGIAHLQSLPMKISNLSRRGSSTLRGLSAAICLFPTYLLAHPGHHHPDETDEFDFLRATFFHSHGTLDYLLAGVAISCVLVACLHGKSAVRIGAVLVALGALAATGMA
jgi:hypothetical protein